MRRQSTIGSWRRGCHRACRGSRAVRPACLAGIVMTVAISLAVSQRRLRLGRNQNAGHFLPLALSCCHRLDVGIVELTPLLPLLRLLLAWCGPVPLRGARGVPDRTHPDA